MNTCKQFRNLISDYIESSLDSAKKDSAKAHVENCSECCDTVKRLEHLKAMLPSLRVFKVSPDFDTILRTRIRIETSLERNKFLSNIFNGPVRIPAYAASLAMVAFAAFFLWNQMTPDGTTDQSRKIRTVATVNGQVIALKDSEVSDSHRQDNVLYEIGQMYFIETLNDSARSLTVKNADSLQLQNRHKSSVNRRQLIRPASF